METNRYALFIIPLKAIDELREYNDLRFTIILGTYQNIRGEEEMLLWGSRADSSEKLRQYQVFDDCVIDVLNKMGLQITIPEIKKN